MEDQPVASLDLLKVELDKQWSEIVGIQTEPEFQLHLKEGPNNIMTDGTLGKFFEDMDKTLKKYKFGTLDRLGLFVELKQITDDGGKELGKHLSTLKGLQHLQLSLKTEISDGGLKEIAVAVGENMKSLENLRVEIANSNQTTDLGVNDFLSNVTKDLPCLTNIVFSLRELDEITDESVGKISSSFNNLKILRSLDLSLIRCVKITDKGLDELMSQFSGDLKGLQAFSLSVRGCNKLTDAALKNLIEQLVKNLGDLQDLKLDFSDCYQITDDGVTGLAVRLVNLQRLKKLSLWFTRCTQLTDQAVLELGNQISDFMKDIEEFHLDVSGQITDEGATGLTLLVTNNLKNLQSLNLEFTGQVTDKGLKDIAAHIVNNALTVKDFNLNLSGCPQITAEALISARNLLKHMPSITIL